MRRLSKILIFLALVALFSLACMTVGRLVADPEPTTEFNEVIESGPLVFKPDSLPDAQTGTVYTVQITVENTRTPVGEFILQEGELPPGLALKQVDGVANTAEISGTPTQAGTYKFVLYVWCFGTNQAGQTGQIDYTIVVK